MSIDQDLSRLEAASRDLWVRNQLAFLQEERAPIAGQIVAPTTTDEVAMAVTEATAAGRKIVPLGAGSGVCGGISATGDELILDLKRLNAIEVDPESGIARLGAGVMGRHAEEACNQHGFTIGHFPSSIACSTVGGWVAARGAGQLSSRYGKIEDICVGATAVLADGSVQRAWRGTRALAEWIGNEGTLAILTEVIFQIRPLRQGWTFTSFMAPNLEEALNAAKQFVRMRPVPSLLRVYDPIDSRIALTHSKGGLARKLPWLLTLPQWTLAAGNLALKKCLIVVGWEGAGPTWVAAKRAADAIGEALSLKHLGPGPGEIWLARRHDVSFKQISILRSRHFADTFEVSCPWTRVASVYRAVRKAISPDAVSMAHFSHAYSDGSAIYFSMAGKIEAYDKTWQRALEAASDAGATISHHHGVGRLKAPLMYREFGGAHRALVRAKDEYDPMGLLNPGCLGLPCAPRPSPPLDQFPGLDRGNGLWCGPVTESVGAIERAARSLGWTLGCAPTSESEVGAWLARDGCNAASTMLGSGRDRVVAVAGTFADGTPYATRVAPRSATGPDLRRRLLDDGSTQSVTLRFARLPSRWLHLHGQFDDPLAAARTILTTGHEPWAAIVQERAVEMWFAADTPANQSLCADIAWTGQRDEKGPALARDALCVWRPWALLQPGTVVGLSRAGGWQVKEAP